MKIRNTVPNAQTRVVVPHTRVSAGSNQTVVSSTTTNFAGAGYPLGILMAITYSQQQSVTNTITTGGSGKGPTVRI